MKILLELCVICVVSCSFGSVLKFNRNPQDLHANWKYRRDEKLFKLKKSWTHNSDIKSGTEHLTKDEQLSLKKLETGSISAKIKQEIASYEDIANKIINQSLNGAGQNQSYIRLADMVDKFGSRMSGSQALEDAIDYMIDKLKEDGLDNVHKEPVMIPHWVRGMESAEMLLPRKHKMSILGLGSSVGTGPDGITADVIVVRSWDELHQQSHQVAGKIVVYNQPYVSYGVTVSYRSNGASEAAKYGAVATLIRSVTPLSINSPHTGQQYYADGVTKIPTACITVEDAEMMQRMQGRGEQIRVHLMMEAQNLDPVQSHNTVAEITGSVYPEQVVLLSGHLDSWDVGEGAMDDGGGAFISWQALSLIKQLGLKPKRTMRVVMWTAEEQGGIGGNAYYEEHKNQSENFDMVMESDIGTFTPIGIQFTGNEDAKKIMESVTALLKSVNATSLLPDAAGTDIEMWLQNGVPGASLEDDYSKYFYFHHSNGDTMTVQDPVQMNLCSAVWAVTAFVVADLDDMLPR